MEYEGGRLLWPLRACDLLIIDDVAQPISPGADNVAKGAGQGTAGADWHEVLKEFEDAMADRLNWLGARRSVWVVECPENDRQKYSEKDQERIHAWKDALTRVLNVSENEIMTVQLEGRPPIPDKFKPLVDKFGKAAKRQTAKKPVVPEPA